MGCVTSKATQTHDDSVKPDIHNIIPTVRPPTSVTMLFKGWLRPAALTHAYLTVQASEIQAPTKPPVVMKGRAAIAAEAATPAADVVIPDIPKSESVLRLLGMSFQTADSRALAMTLAAKRVNFSLTCRDCHQGQSAL